MTRNDSIQLQLASTGLARLSSLALGLGFQVLLVRLMPIEEYATFAIALAISFVFGSLASCGINRAVSRFLPEVLFDGRIGSLGLLAVRYLLGRMASLIIFLPLGMFALEITPGTNMLSFTYRALILFWSSTLLVAVDVEAFAQVFGAYRAWSIAITSEIAVRFIVLLTLSSFVPLNAVLVILVWSVSSMLMIVFVLVAITRRGVSRSNCGIGHTIAARSLRDRVLFTAAVYLSGCAWLASSPASARLAGAASLSAVALVAVSFIQTLVSAAHRGLPVHLYAAVLEPLVVTESLRDGGPRKVGLILSLFVKAETVLLLFAVAVFTPASGAVLALLSKADLASFGFLLPLLVLQALATSYYRIVEILAGLAMRRSLFLGVAPAGMLTLFLLYITTPLLGVMSFVIWPSLDICFRLSLSWYALRKSNISAAFDRPKLAALGGSSLAASIFALAIKAAIGPDSANDLAVGVISGILFLLSLFLLKPIRHAEWDALKGSLPPPLRRITSALTAVGP